MFQNGCYHLDQRTLNYLLAMFEPNPWYNFFSPLDTVESKMLLQLGKVINYHFYNWINCPLRYLIEMVWEPSNDQEAYNYLLAAWPGFAGPPARGVLVVLVQGLSKLVLVQDLSKVAFVISLSKMVLVQGLSKTVLIWTLLEITRYKMTKSKLPP